MTTRRKKRKPIYWTDWEPGLKPGEGTNKDLLKTFCLPWLIDEAIKTDREKLKKLGL